MRDGLLAMFEQEVTSLCGETYRPSESVHRPAGSEMVTIRTTSGEECISKRRVREMLPSGPAACRRTPINPAPPMLTLSGSLRVFLALEPCDMRKSFDGLHAEVISRLGDDPQGLRIPRSGLSRTQTPPSFRHALTTKNQKKPTPPIPQTPDRRLSHLPPKGAPRAGRATSPISRSAKSTSSLTKSKPTRLPFARLIA